MPQDQRLDHYNPTPNAAARSVCTVDPYTTDGSQYCVLANPQVWDGSKFVEIEIKGSEINGSG